MTAAQLIVADLTARGFVLHPLSKPDDKGYSPGKRPILKGWQTFSNTPDDMEKYIEEGYNIGLVCGKASGVDAIDFDIDLFKDELLNGFELDTLISGHREGRGHLLFQHRDDIFSEKHHFIGIEYFGNNKDGAGSNLVIPPSIHYSGEPYKWQKPDVPLAKIPDQLKENWLALCKKEDALHEYFKKCRYCFTKGSKKYDKTDVRSKGIWDRPDSITVHGMDGRQAILSIMGELKTQGCPDELLHMACKRFFGKGYKFDETAEALKYIKPIPPKCETLRQYLNVECDGCTWQPRELHTSSQNRPDLVLAPTIIDPSATTDLSNAKRFVQLHQRNIRFIPSRDRWIVFDGSRWVEKKKDKAMVPLVEEMIRELEREATSIVSEKTRDKLLKHANNTESENRIMACIRLAASQPEILANPEDFDKDKYLINFQNGTMDLHTGQLREFRREDMITRMANVPYIPGDILLWHGFLNKFFAGDVEIIKYMQKLCGMALTGDVSEELFHIFYGGGANGKTTFMTTLNRILGDTYFKTIGVETLLKRGQKAIANDVARMKGTRIIWANEPEFDDILTEGKIKKLVSKERLLGEMKFLEPEEFFPEFTAIMSCNHKPRLIGVDKGIRRRIRFISWGIEIPENEKDIHFAEKLATEDPSIAAWAVEGCLLWQKEGLNPPEKILASTADYQDEMDKYAEFFNNVIVRDPRARTPHEMLYLVFKLWTQYQEIYTISKIAFTQMLLERGFKKADGGRIGGRQFKGFEGITLNSESVTVNYSETVTDVTNLMKSVTEYFVAPAYEKQEKYDRLLPILRVLLTCFNSGGTHARTENIETLVTSVTNDMQSINVLNNQLVTSVTLVTEIIKLLKEQYDQLNKPDSIQDLAREKINMRNSIILELNESLPDNQEIPGNELIDKIVDDYCKVRGWQ